MGRKREVIGSVLLGLKPREHDQENQQIPTILMAHIHHLLGLVGGFEDGVCQVEHI